MASSISPSSISASRISASWITSRRLRAHGLILALCLWSVYLWNISTPGLVDRAGNLKGTDFLHFYTLGSIALTHHGVDLYNMRVQAEIAAQRVLIDRVAGPGKNARAKRLAANPSIALEFDSFDGGRSGCYGGRLLRRLPG